MRAAARAVARPRRTGAVGFPTLRSAPPLTLRQTGPKRLSIVSSAAGPLGGDQLTLDLDMAAGCDLEVTSIAASMALPAPTADGAASPWSCLTTTVDVGPDATLDWYPEPLIACAGARHRADVVVRLGAGARLRWREVLVLGRESEPSGTVHAGMAVDLDGLPLLRHALRLGTGADAGWDGPAGIGDARVVGSELRVGPAADAPPATIDGGVRLPLEAGPACLLTALGPDVRSVLAGLSALAPERLPSDAVRPGR